MLCNVKRINEWSVESIRAQGNCISPYIFSSFILSCVFDFMKNNHGCLGVMQSLQYKNLSKAALKRDTDQKRYRLEHYNLSKE